MLAAPYAAVFAPWPRALDTGAAFLVRIVADSGEEEWAQPLEVELPRPDATGRDGVGMVVLRQPSAFPVALGPTVTPHQLTEALRAGPAEDVLPALGPERFGPLTRRSRPPVVPTADSSGAVPRPEPALPDTYTVRNRTAPDALAFSICRIFRWD